MNNSNLMGFSIKQILLAVGGLINATCGNATELIIALFALHQNKLNVVKSSLLGSILSNLLLVLGTSLFFGGVANLKKEQRFDRVRKVKFKLKYVFIIVSQLIIIY